LNTAAPFRTELNEFSEQLSSAINGTCDFTAAGVAMYTSDASNYRQVPLGVVYPRSSDDIKKTVLLCKQHGHPVLMRGGGTSQNGQCVNNAIVIDCSQFMTRIIDIDSGLTRPRTAVALWVA